MTNSEISRVIVAGGGLEGWTAASGLASALKGTGVSLVVVNVPRLVNVDPAQYVPPDALQFFRDAGIDEDEIIRETGATFRLGTAVSGLKSEDDNLFRPFGVTGAHIGFIHFHHLATKLRLSGEPFELNAFSPNAAASAAGRFKRADDNDGHSGPPIAYGLNLNTDKLIALLRTHAVNKGVEIIEGELTDVVRASDGSRIGAVIVDEDRRIEGDLFIDCTGESALLIREGMNVPYVDWSHWLPCDRRINVTTRGRPGMPPILRNVATDQGWLVQAPLQYRTANQFCYSSHCTSDEDASNFLVDFLGDVSADAMAFGETRNGHRQHFWSGNCIAIGTSAGRVEPLEVSDFHLVQRAVRRLVQLFPTRKVEPTLAHEYNRATQEEHECLRDYTQLNYLVSEWRDSPFWKLGSGADANPSLTERVELFRSRGRVTLREHETFDRDGWVAALLSVGVLPEGYDPLLDSMELPALRAHFDTMLAAIGRAVQGMPTQRDYLDRLIG